MKPIVEFLSDLRRCQIGLWTDGGNLRYTGPKEAITPELLAKIKERKGEILDFFSQVNSDSKTPIQAIPRNQNLPLSFAQQRLWFLDQLESATATYNIPWALRLVGNVNVLALEQALIEIVRRHEVLRTSFPSIESQPTQVINPEPALIFKIVNLSN